MRSSEARGPKRVVIQRVIDRPCAATWRSRAVSVSSSGSQPLRLPIPAANPVSEETETPSFDRGIDALVDRARTGDLEAWARLYQETFDAVFRHVCYLVGEPTLAEDLVQDAYARAMTSVRSYDGRSSFVTWLRGVALNVVRMYWRRTKTKDRAHGHLQALQELEASSQSPPDREHLRDRKMRVVYEILETLPVHLREAFVLRDLEGLSTARAAQQLGISTNNLAVRASRAWAKLRKELVRRGWLGGGRT